MWEVNSGSILGHISVKQVLNSVKLGHISVEQVLNSVELRLNEVKTQSNGRANLKQL